MKKLLVLLLLFAAMNVNAQWQPDVRLTSDTNWSSTSYNNAWFVASSGPFVHVVWCDNRDGNVEIYYKRSTDAGVSWGTDTRLTYNAYNPLWASIAVSGLDVHIVWTDWRNGNYEIYYKRSTDAGINWSADTRLTNNGLGSWNPSIALAGLDVHIVWQDYRDGNWEIYYKHSTDAGISWGADTRLTNNNSESWFPSVAVSGSVVHVVWRDTRDGNQEIYHKRSTNEGQSWESDTRLTNNIAYSWNPSIAVSGTLVNIVWHDERDGNNEIYYKRSTDTGVSWGTDTRLTNSNTNSGNSSIAVSGLVINVVWQDDRDSNYEIYYKRSTDSGVNWEVDTRLTYNNAVSEFPSISISGTIVHVVWSDERDLNKNIYYKRNPTGNPIGIQNISTETPSKYSLSQNYPNPFNPTTKIRFDIANGFPVKTSGNDKVVLKVYDIMGREIQTLVNESLRPGTYEVTFDGSILNSGVYFYKLIVRHSGSSTDGFTETKKMLMIK